MKNNKFFLAVIVGSVVSFLLGYLIYGVLLKSTMQANCGLDKELEAKVFKSMEKPDAMILGTIFVSNIFGALLLTTIAQWANARSFGSGMKVGAIVGVLVSLNFDLLWYAMSNLYTPTGLAIDVCAGTVMTALSSGVIAMILGKGNATS